MTDLLIPLSSLQACEPDLVGPKAATLAVLGRAGLPVPEGVCLTAHAYRLQMTALGFEDTTAALGSAAAIDARRLSMVAAD